MADYIDRQTAIRAVMDLPDCPNGYSDTYDKACIVGMLEEVPSIDAVEVVRCKDCKHRFVNEHYGEKGYMKIKAMCSLDTDDPFELGRNAYDDDWFCADGERKDG